MGDGPWAADLPVMWTGKVCELLPRPTQSIIQQMEHINRNEGERAWLGEVGVDEHLTQTPFVLWAGVCVMGEWGGHCKIW